MNSGKITLANQYVDLLKSVFGGDLVSVFLFGSVARGEDTPLSDIDLMAILEKPPAFHQLRKLGKPGRFSAIWGIGEFREISCAINNKERFLKYIRHGEPREGVNPLREAVVLFDTGFIANLKRELEAGVISLKKDAYRDYLLYGDIRRSCLEESIIEMNTRNARSDASAAASHYLRAYFLHRYNEMVLSKVVLKERIKEENPEIAALYEKIIAGCYNADLVEAIRTWAVGKIEGVRGEIGCGSEDS